MEEYDGNSNLTAQDEEIVDELLEGGSNSNPNDDPKAGLAGEDKSNSLDCIVDKVRGFFPDWYEKEGPYYYICEDTVGPERAMGVRWANELYFMNTTLAGAAARMFNVGPLIYETNNKQVVVRVKKADLLRRFQIRKYILQPKHHFKVAACASDKSIVRVTWLTAPPCENQLVMTGADLLELAEIQYERI